MRPDRSEPFDLAGWRLAAALVAERPLAVPAGRVRIGVEPGDAVRVGVGETVAVGAVLVDRLRDPHLDEAPAVADGADGAGLRSGTRVPVRPEAGSGGRRATVPPSELGEGARLPEAGGEDGSGGASGPSGELLFRRRDRWLVVRGEHTDRGVSPVAGTVVAVRPGRSIEIDATGWRIPGTAVVGEPSFGPLALALDGGLDARPTGLDVGLAGTIAIIGGRVDAETVTRARAMGLRGLVVGSLAGRVARAVEASEARQRAALHRRPPFAVLVLDGELRRPIPGPLRDLLTALGGRTVGIVSDPPGLVFPDPLPEIVVAPDRAAVRAGPLVGLEGRLMGLAGVWRFPLGVHLLAARLVTDAGEEHVVPIGDLVRFSGIR